MKYVTRCGKTGVSLLYLFLLLFSDGSCMLQGFKARDNLWLPALDLSLSKMRDDVQIAEGFSWCLR